MSIARSAIRAHIGRALGRLYYASSTTTGSSSNAAEVVDSARTEHDKFWAGATIRISAQDRLVRGGAGASTDRSPTLTLDRALSSTPTSGTAYELLKTVDFNDVDEAIDDTLADMWPYFYDPVDNVAVAVLLASKVEYALTATWREIVKAELEVYASSPTIYRPLIRGYHYDLIETATSTTLLLLWTPTGTDVGLKVRVTARAIPTLGSTDASTTIHPYQVIVPGALAYLYGKSSNADEGALSQKWERKATASLALFEKRKHDFAMTREPIDTKIPMVLVG